MNLVDSSGWIEFFQDGPNASFFSGVIERVDHLLVPTMAIYEVRKFFLRSSIDRIKSDVAIAAMRRDIVVPLTDGIAMSAAHISIMSSLAAASIMLATARMYEATLWTQDADFEDIASVKLVRKRTK